MQTKAIHDQEPERTTSTEDFVIFYEKFDRHMMTVHLKSTDYVCKKCD